VTAGDLAALAPALDALPLFPLPNVVLFPGVALPLHVFEPRYRAMLADCLATHRCIAMALALEGGERPRLARVAGAGRVVHHQPLPDGRSNILLHGVARVAFEELPFVAPYRRARARVLEEVDSPVQAVRTMLHAAASAFLAEARRHRFEIDFELPPDASVSATADLCAHHLVLDTAARQRVLEELDVAARALLVTGELASQTARLVGEGGRGPSN
jgi:Lon protease-like protein